MTYGRKKLMFAVVPIACLYLFNGSLNAGMSVAEAETDQTAKPSEKTAVDVEQGEQQTHSENENIIDRVFSPLDKAVTDINRDLSEEDGGTAGESGD
jgi:hypothetical protein